ncbi:MAG: carboxypeptidase-like regulatory domain-containing protein [Candidatus Angelobacter sp.]
MKRLLAYVIFASLAVPSVAVQTSCPSVSALVVDDYVIEGTATNGETLLRFAQVSLYSQGKLVRRATADADGRFTFDHLSPGVYRLSIQGLGNYDVKVVVTAVKTLQQRPYYWFYNFKGCLGWGSDTN